MRKIISNATVIPGDGKTILPDHSVVIENGIVIDIIPARFLAYDLAEKIIDVGGAAVIPGIINHHSHGSTVGPFNVFGEKFPQGRVMYNLDRHLVHGSTTVIAACGWPTQAEAQSTNNLHPINVRTGTLHSPGHLAHSMALDGSGIRPWHEKTTVKEQLDQGAIYIGEAGVPCAAYGAPQISRELNRSLTVAQVQEIKEAALGVGIDPDAFNKTRMESALKTAGLNDLLSTDDARDLMNRHMVKPNLMMESTCQEFAELSLKHNVPLLFHNTPDTVDLALEMAAKLGPLFVALHTNYAFSPDQSIACAKEIKRHGGWVDMFTGDEFGVRMFTKSKAAGFALLKEGLVDLISTDYIAGAWDSIPLVLSKAIEAGVLTLPKAVQMTSASVVRALPRLGSHKATIKPGHPADLTVVEMANISQVNMVLIAGEVVAINGRAIYPGCRN